MSGLLQGRSMYVPLDMASKLTLVALADHANDDGTEARPGLRRLGIKTGLSRRAVQDCLSHLEAHDLIKAAGYRRGGHGRTTNWVINVAILRFFTDWYEDDPTSYESALDTVQEVHPSTVQEVHPSTVQEVHSLEKNSAVCDRKQCSVTQLTVQRAAPQPSGTVNKPHDFANEEPSFPQLSGESRKDWIRRFTSQIRKT